MGAAGHLAPAMLLLLLLLPLPGGAWYKHVASPRLHTVGRAAGLLMGLRRSPYAWRRALGPDDDGTPGPGAALPPAPSARELWRVLRGDPGLDRPVGPLRSFRAFGEAKEQEQPRSVQPRAWVGPRAAPPWT